MASDNTMTIMLAMMTGFGAGYILERGDFCFHSTWRELFKSPSKPDLFRAYLLLLLVSIPLVQGMIALGWITPWIPPFAWPANILGGLIFGAGMVVAASCITGLFYKLGHGMLGTLVALAAWAVGDLLTYLGPLSPLREALNAPQISVGGQSATLGNTLGVAAPVLLVLLGIAAGVYLLRSPRNSRGVLWGWLPLGAVLGAFLSLAWLTARAGGSDYTFGTSRVPTGIFEALSGSGGDGALWIPLTLISLVPGTLIAARLSGTLWVRGETMRRYAELGSGGLLMGIGAGIAGGCNLGHSMVGVPLLSLGSITSTLAIVAGVYVTDRVIKKIKFNRTQWESSE